jgi:hypothetical protein
MTPLDTKAIRARADAATKGPWAHSEKELWACVATPTHLGQQVAAVAGSDPDLVRATASFIAAARTDVPALCDEVDRLRAAITQALVRLTLVDGDHVPDPEGAVIALRGAIGAEVGP